MSLPLVVWDIDKTLVDAGPSSADAMNTAVSKALDRTVSHGVRFGGKTDPRIAREILLAVGVPAPHDDHVADILDHLEEILAERAELVAEHGRVLPGVREVLTKLRAAGTVQTVLTGNIKPNAIVKLAAFGLGEFVDLDIAAFGSDDSNRNVLLPLVLERAERAYGRRWSPDETWVIGDTEHDCECAAAAGAHCLLVGTGRTSVADLAALGPDVVLPDLSDVDRVVDKLLGVGRWCQNAR